MAGRCAGVGSTTPPSLPDADGLGAPNKQSMPGHMCSRWGSTRAIAVHALACSLGFGVRFGGAAMAAACMARLR